MRPGVILVCLFRSPGTHLSFCRVCQGIAETCAAHTGTTAALDSQCKCRPDAHSDRWSIRPVSPAARWCWTRTSRPPGRNPSKSWGTWNHDSPQPQYCCTPLWSAVPRPRRVHQRRLLWLRQRWAACPRSQYPSRSARPRSRTRTTRPTSRSTRRTTPYCVVDGAAHDVTSTVICTTVRERLETTRETERKRKCWQTICMYVWQIDWVTNANVTGA